MPEQSLTRNSKFNSILHLLVHNIKDKTIMLKVVVVATFLALATCQETSTSPFEPVADEVSLLFY